MSDIRSALEAALVENPDDIATHMAHADYLSDQPDPDSQARAEFIRLQLALEDPKLPAEQRKALREQESALLKTHERKWLGELAPFLLDHQPPPSANPEESPRTRYSHNFWRGWLGWVSAHGFDSTFTRTLARAPEARLLLGLTMNEPRTDQPDEPRPPAAPGACSVMAPFWLIGAPNLRNVLDLGAGERGEWGSAFDGESIIDLVRSCPCLEGLSLACYNLDTETLLSLHLPHLERLSMAFADRWSLGSLATKPTLGRLRELSLDFRHLLDDQPHPLSAGLLRAVVNSPIGKSLVHLSLRRTYLGDEGILALVESGILARLERLWLRNGTVTAEGARLIGGCRELHPELDIDLDYNCITEAGAGLLKRVGRYVSVEDQWRPSGDPVADAEAMFAYDME